MRSLTKTQTLAIGLTVLSLASCAPDADSKESDVTREDGTLLEIQVNGARVVFNELEPGFPGVIAESEPGKNPLADPAVRDLNLLQKYEYWTHQPAPPQLRAAYERARATASEDQSEDEALDTEGVDSVPQSAAFHEKAVLSDAQFRGIYCINSQPICHTNVTGTGEYERKTTRVGGGLNAVQGNVRLQIRLYKPAGGWRNVVVRDILQGVDTWYAYGDSDAFIRRPIKTKVYEADGDVYHWSLDWW